MQKVDKPWGHELIWATTDKYVGKILNIKSGHRLSLQFHRIKDETIIVKSGTLLFEYGQSTDFLTSLVLNEGQSFHIRTGLIHRMSGVTDVEVIEVSTPELFDVVRLEDDYNRKDSGPKFFGEF